MRLGVHEINLHGSPGVSLSACTGPFVHENLARLLFVSGLMPLPPLIYHVSTTQAMPFSLGESCQTSRNPVMLLGLETERGANGR
jgi:hypothetical protein